MQIHGVPVLALTMVDSLPNAGGRISFDTSVLAVVRRPGVNISHPDVVSVPTQRIPLALAEAILDRSIRAQRGNNPVTYAVDSLFCRKLGLADALEQRRVRYRAEFGAIKHGVSRLDSPSGDDIVVGTITMLNLLVHISDGREYIPAETCSYSRLLWVKAGAFIKGAMTRNVAEMDPSFEEREFCVHGLCVETACSTLESLS